MVVVVVVGILYHRGTPQVVGKGFTPTWVGALQLYYSRRPSKWPSTYYIFLHGQRSILQAKHFYNSIAATKAKVSIVIADYYWLKFRNDATESGYFCPYRA